eukprot:scaffold303381_cov30-Tisochrysis_lutea.AAC.3
MERADALLSSPGLPVAGAPPARQKPHHEQHPTPQLSRPETPPKQLGMKQQGKHRKTGSPMAQEVGEN